MTTAVLEAGSTRERWRVALVVAGVTGLFALVRFMRASVVPSDLDQLWYAARTLLDGGDPYEVVGPNRAFAWPWPLFYPLPAVLLAVPLTVLPIAVARFVVSVVSAGVLGFAIGGRWRVLWPLFLSMSYLLAISRNQWSPLLLATVWMPLLGFVVAAKPNVGLIAVATQRPRHAVWVVTLAAALAALSFLVRPSWFSEWYGIIRTLPNQKIALLQPGGFVLLAAGFAWRKPGGRALLAASVVPQTPALYDALPLFAVCHTARQTLVVAALTHVLQWGLIALGPFATYDAAYARYAQLNVVLLLIPLLVLVLWDDVARFAARRGGRLSATERPMNWTRIDSAVGACMALSLGVHLWLLFHP